MRSTRSISNQLPDLPLFASLGQLLISLLVLLAVLLFPGHPKDFVAASLVRLPLELPVLVFFLMLVKGRGNRWLCAFVVLLMGLLLLLRLADLGSYLAFNRRFSPLLEWHLIADGWNLASTSIGVTEAVAISVVVLILLVLLGWILYRCLRTIARVGGTTRKTLLAVCIVTATTGLIALSAERWYDYSSPIEAKLLPELGTRVTTIRKSITDQQVFVDQLQHDAVLDVHTPTFSALSGRDIILVFVESYGRGYLDAQRYAQRAKTRLAAVTDTIAGAGLNMRSGWLTSPIRGGRSWLAHATLQSGLLVSNQARFDRLITTNRQSLTRLFQQAGWHTIGLMPAIQFHWPEGTWYGYNELHTNNEMAYSGDRFGYVTMPDQYTLSHFETAVRHQQNKPVMATLALLSTHAPWTPLPKKIDWSLVGDGSVYDGSYRFGEPISWKFRSKVQDMYADSFDYTLDVIGEYAARYADDAMIIIVGDHQPPPIINGWGKSADVPIHIITRDTALLERLPDEFWVNGMIPNDAIRSQSMASFRQSLSTLFEQ